MPSCVAANGLTYPLTPSGTYGPLGLTYVSGNYIATSTSFLRYQTFSEYPSAGDGGGWAGGGGGSPADDCSGSYGGVDYCVGGILADLWITIIGPGLLTIRTTGGLSVGRTCHSATSITATLKRSGTGLTIATATAAPGTDLVLTVPDDGFCAHYVNVEAATGSWGFVSATWNGNVVPDAAFASDQVGSLAVAFTDLSSGTPTSWAWQFGDGATSTLQNPVYAYASPGTYLVTLTATNATGSDSISHDVVVTADVFVPPEPALALLEIWTLDAESPRWDDALWGEASWGSAGWQSVTPLGVTVRIQWGSTRPELGILSVPDAGSWYATFHDPLRLLDPANADSPYAGDLKPGLPIRVTHRGISIRTGVSDVIAHSMADRQAVIRGSDAISLMARADVPSDVSLPDTLRARAVAAIAAAGINVRVEPVPPTGDPALAPQPDGPMTVWEIVKDAAQSVLSMPYVNNDNVLCFRSYAVPLDRGRVIGSPNLVDLQSIVDTAGLISVVQVQQTAGDGGLLIERRNTPMPYFGERVFKRANETPDAEGFATAILNDRAVRGIRWVPGDVYAPTASDVEYFAQLQAMERVTLRMTETEPDIVAPVLIVGGTVTVEGRVERSASWSFRFEAASTNEDVVLLTRDGGTATDYLTTESGSAYLHGDI